MSQGDPYASLAEHMSRRGPGAPGIRVGTVLEASPLRVNVAGTVQSGNIWIAAELLAGASRSVSLSGSVSVSDTLTPVSGPVSGTVTAEASGSALRPGDEVLLLSPDDQVFYLICKVVRA